MADRRAIPTVVVGRESNLSRRLSALLGNCHLISARHVLACGLESELPDGTFNLILNAFQPAGALRDVSDPVGYVNRAIMATASTLAQLPVGRCHKLIYTSSASVYGNSVECRENGPIGATGLHSGLKVANESMVRDFCTTHDVDCTITRVFNMYGRDDSFSVIAKIILAARTDTILTIANDGNAIRDFIHVDDVVSSYAAVLERPDLPIVNIATGTGISIRTVLDAAALHGRPVCTRSEARSEIRISTADVSILGEFVDVSSFTQVIDFVVEQLGCLPGRPR
jgi:nucleoside-diphosphate-sugar epimerase